LEHEIKIVGPLFLG